MRLPLIRGRDEKSGAGARECQDRADHVWRSLRRNALRIDLGKEPCQKDTEAAPPRTPLHHHRVTHVTGFLCYVCSRLRT